MAETCVVAGGHVGARWTAMVGVRAKRRRGSGGERERWRGRVAWSGERGGSPRRRGLPLSPRRRRGSAGRCARSGGNELGWLGRVNREERDGQEGEWAGLAGSAGWVGRSPGEAGGFLSLSSVFPFLLFFSSFCLFLATMTLQKYATGQNNFK